MKDNTLIVSECFYSIQGEGRHAGTASVFLRLAGCNLLCESKSWRCDTIEVWRKGKATAFDDVIKEEWIEFLRHGAHLVITGGEPMLHQDRLCDFIYWFGNSYGWVPVIEVETNGTIQPCARLISWVNQWNVSFKLSNSGEPWERRYNENALRFFNSQKRADFKIVIKSEGDLMELVNEYSGVIDFKKVILMPAGSTQAELAESREVCVNWCKAFPYFKYSDRLHIVIWNQKTGV